jgi:hypothetical protein
LRWVLISLLFVAGKFGDLSLQEPELRRVTGSGTGHLPPALIRVDVVKEARLRHGSNKLGKTDSDSLRDKSDHKSVGLPAITDPIYQSLPKSNPEGGREVYMVEQGEELPEKTAEEIALEEADKGNRHNGLQSNSGSLDDEPRDGAPSRRRHSKFNSWHPAGQDRLQDQSRSIRDEIGRIEYQGEQVYRAPSYNALASRMLIDQLTPHLPKDNEEVNTHVNRLQAMLDVAL